MKHNLIPQWLRIPVALSVVAMTAALAAPATADPLSLQSAPPVVVKTVPVAGSADVDSALTEIRVTFSKPMQDGSWSWSTWGEENYPETTGQPHYLADGRTCVLPVKLKPGKFYATWLNSDKFHNFKDRTDRSAVPYLLTFETAKAGAGGGGSDGAADAFRKRYGLARAGTGGGGSGGAGGGGGGEGAGGASGAGGFGGGGRGGAGADARLKNSAKAPAPAPVPGLTQATVLQHDNGIQTGMESINGSGHAVQFTRPGDARYVEAVQIFASRYGTPEPPNEDFHLYLLNDRQQVLADVPFPYSLIERGDMKWYTLRTPSIEVPEKFTVALAFNPHKTKGIYLAYSGTNGPTCYSLIGLPGDGFEFWKPAEWMVRPSLTTEPTKAKGFQSLADWKAPVAQDPFAGCRIVALGGDKSEGMQSYGGRGPAVRFKPADLLAGVPAGEPLVLNGVRLFASRYGSGYSPETTKFHVQVLDAQGGKLADAAFPYAKLSYRVGWVDLVFDQPVVLKQPGELVTIAFDPEATRTKGVYFHYQTNAPTSHSLAGRAGDGFKELSDREWMMRACFAKPPGS
jgi:hypothetical protein